MIDLMTRAAQDYYRGKEVFMPKWEILLKWANLVKMKNANAHA